MTDIKDLKTSNIDHKEEVMALGKEAKEFLLSHSWCNGIEEGYLDRGWGYILCVFYFHIKPSSKEVDDTVWIIVGDIPSAYIDIQSAKNGNEALQCYVGIMQDWVNHVKEGKSVEDCYPVNVPPERKFAEMLEKRLSLIEEDYIES